MKSNSLKYLIFTIVSLFFMTGCRDDFGFFNSKEIEWGIPIRVEIPYQIGDYPEVTRGDIEVPGVDREIESIWIGFFDASTDSEHKLIFSRTLNNQGIWDHEDMNQISLTGTDEDENAGISTGSYYIAAVANPIGNEGIRIKNDNSTETGDLSVLLNKIETFADYQNIALLKGEGSYGIISTPTGNMPMQGVYVYEEGKKIHENFTYNPKSATSLFASRASSNVDITLNGNEENGIIKLPGAIHFRRMMSQNKFKITYDETKIKDFEILQVQVYNVPMYSWIAERGDEENIKNAGDNNNLTNSKWAAPSGMSNEASKYPNAPLILGSSVNENNDESGTKVFTFDWWQLENKRISSNSACSSYAYRETERKDNDLNTGIYEALNPTGSKSDDNCATFAEIRVAMKIRKSNADYQDGTVVPDEEEPGWDDDKWYKFVETNYTIHLGYCEGDTEAEKAKDFNCRRNTKYLYKVKISDVNKIEVEARSLGETQPGAEGLITNITDNYYEADAHYCVYNIQLTDEERTKLKWQIRYYDITEKKFKDIGNVNYANSLNTDNAIRDEMERTTDYLDAKVDSMYWTWVEFRPTTGPNVIADYKPMPSVKKGKEEVNLYPDGLTFNLRGINDLTNHPGYTEGSDEKGKWYTMFINEYVYESSGEITYTNLAPGDQSENIWKQFVNIPSRMVWLKVEAQKSPDTESVITKSKYAVNQKSIQTFYSLNAGSAAGMENDDENFGILDNFKTGNIGKAQAIDSRDIAFKVFCVNAWDDTNSTTKKDWTQFINTNALLSDKKGVYAFADELGSTYATDVVCANRNRDLNGNGKIDQNEMRWFVPTMRLYEDFVIGSPSILYPLFDFSKYQKGTAAPTPRDINHYNSADKEMLWAEEGMSTSENSAGGKNVRCVRFMGTDLRRAPWGGMKIEQAVVLDTVNHTVTFNFRNEAIRPNTSVPIPWHTINSDLNRPPRKLEYHPEIIGIPYVGDEDWFSILATGMKKDGSAAPSEFMNGNPCDIYNVNADGTREAVQWRIPNQAELAAILFAGFVFPENVKYNSCTREFFQSPDRGYLGVFGVLKRSATAGFGGTYNRAVLCVRDVK